MQFIIVTLDFFDENEDNIEDGVCLTPKVFLFFHLEAQIYFLSRSLLFSVCQRIYSYL